MEDYIYPPKYVAIKYFSSPWWIVYQIYLGVLNTCFALVPPLWLELGSSSPFFNLFSIHDHLEKKEIVSDAHINPHAHAHEIYTDKNTQMNEHTHKHTVKYEY